MASDMKNFLYYQMDLEFNIFHSIVDEISEYILQLNLKPVTVTHLNIHKTLIKCSKLCRYLSSLQCGIINDIVVLHNYPYHGKINPHIDYSKSDGSLIEHSYLALNFPVNNCENTYVGFYNPDGPIQHPVRHLDNDIYYLLYPNQEWIEIDRYVLNKPTVVNTNHYHSIVNTTDKLRISFSVRFRKDPWHLI